MQNIGLFVDVVDLYYHLGRRFGSAKLNYSSYVDFLSDLGTPKVMTAYGYKKTNEADKFIARLQAVGFETKFKVFQHRDHYITRNVELAIDVISSLDKFDTLILGSSHIELLPLIEYLKTVDSKMRVIIFASRIPKEMESVADSCIEISESMLEGYRIEREVQQIAREMVASEPVVTQEQIKIQPVGSGPIPAELVNEFPNPHPIQQPVATEPVATEPIEEQIKPHVMMPVGDANGNEIDPVNME